MATPRLAKCLFIGPTDVVEALYEDYLKPAAMEAGFKAEKGAVRSAGERSILDSVESQIRECDVVVADITAARPNVMLEIGMAHALGKKLVFLSSSPTQSCPQYLKAALSIHYSRGKATTKNALRVRLKDALARIREDAGGGRRPASERATKLVPEAEGEFSLGITHFFEKDDGSFRDALWRDVGQARKRLVFIGWGLAFLLAHPVEHLEPISARLLAVNKEGAKLPVSILLADPEHAGLKAGIGEEARAGLNVIPDWPTTFFEVAMKWRESCAPRIRSMIELERLSYLPTAMTVAVDDIFYLRVYGPPNRSGGSVPWMRIDSRGVHTQWRAFLENLVQFALKDAARKKT